MTTVSLNEFYLNVKKYIQNVLDGQEVIISNEHTPVIQIEPIHQRLSEPRPFGLGKGEIRITDDFNDELPEDILASFEGK